MTVKARWSTLLWRNAQAAKRTPERTSAHRLRARRALSRTRWAPHARNCDPIIVDGRQRLDLTKLGEFSGKRQVKRGGPFMHHKAHAIDGQLLRTGSANFSTSGENARDS